MFMKWPKSQAWFLSKVKDAAHVCSDYDGVDHEKVDKLLSEINSLNRADKRGLFDTIKVGTLGDSELYIICITISARKSV